MNQDPIRMTSLALVSAILEQRSDINRLILKRIDDTTWEVTLLDERRPNDLRRMAELSAGRYSYERNVKRGFESIAGYDIDSDCQYRVIYRLPQGNQEHQDQRSVQRMVTICKACEMLEGAVEQTAGLAAHLLPDAPIGSGVQKPLPGKGAFAGPLSPSFALRCSNASCSARWLKMDGPDGPQWEILSR